MSNNKENVNQAINKYKRDMGRKPFGDMDKAVEDLLREERIKRSQEELEEREKLVEEQRRSYEHGISSQHIGESGNAGLNVEPVEGGLPTEIIEGLQEVKKGSQEDSSVRKPQLLPRGLRLFVRNLRIKK